MLKVKKISKTFDKKLVLNKVSFQVKKGQIYGLLGPNGAGKTTTLKIITTLMFPDEGIVEINKYNVFLESESAKEKIAYIPDNPTGYGRLTGKELVYFTAGLYGYSVEQIKKDYETYIDLFELGDIEDQTFENYSRGNKQKFSIIAGLVHNPSLLLFDEPIVGLDPKSIILVAEILENFKKQGGAVVISTHTLDFAEDVCDTFGILNKGKLIAEGSLNEIKILSGGQSKDLNKIFLTLTAIK